ncbi:LPXTG cell wall anchor domain-containing protein, partial [Streptococcus pneumoniae]
GSTNSRPQETITNSRQELPNTGEKQSVKSGLLGLILGLTGLGLVAKRRKRDDED